LRERKIESQPSVTPLQRRILALEQQIDLLRAETRSRLLVQPPERVSGPEEAEALISRYLAGGMPDGAIIDRLSRGGVPVSFVQRAIGKYRSKTEGQKPEREVVPTPATEGKKADEQPKS
ncbi:MAG TPA: hypothetical protein VES66_07725, partial [Terriglobales bacterium]|nr:hypothetical protein [Terriglobales bacterium]